MRQPASHQLDWLLHHITLRWRGRRYPVDIHRDTRPQPDWHGYVCGKDPVRGTPAAVSRIHAEWSYRSSEPSGFFFDLDVIVVPFMSASIATPIELGSRRWASW